MMYSNAVAYFHERSLRNYLEDIRSIPLINIDDEISLAKKIRRGDLYATQTLVKANLRFVISIAKQYINNGIPLNDLISEGNIGLIQAARKFDESKGNKFISYAVWWIRQKIIQAIQEQTRTIRLPQNKILNLGKIQKARNELSQELERVPTSEELAEHLEMSCEQINAMDSYALNTVSLDRPLCYREKNQLMDIVADTREPEPDQALERNDWNATLARILDTLKPREKEVILKYFGIDQKRPYTLEEIATEYQVTRERVRQIKEKALMKLRAKSRSCNLKADMVYNG